MQLPHYALLIINTMNTPNQTIQWLLDSDPAIRWQAQRDLAAAPAAQYSAERAKVATEGWGASLLAAQAENGTWPGMPRLPEVPTLRTLHLLRDMGLDPASPQAKRAIERVRQHVLWLMNIQQEELPKEQDISWWRKPFFEGEVEPCVNGRVLTVSAYFGVDVQPIVERLLTEQMADGGWNCEQENGSTRGSFNTTICVLEGLLEYERASGGSDAVRAARQRGEEYLLQRHLMRRLSTGQPIERDGKAGIRFTDLSYPAGWRYDILRALDYFRAAGGPPDARMQAAVDALRAAQRPDGRWPLGPVFADEPTAEPGIAQGDPSRWNTLRALRVLQWYSG